MVNLGKILANDDRFAKFAKFAKVFPYQSFVLYNIVILIANCCLKIIGCYYYTGLHTHTLAHTHTHKRTYTCMRTHNSNIHTHSK